ncbi:helix-turn-helix domain-containing protein [Sediminibacillus massiliensis]|uniref:helix-turn-helix domain-containing protein n=1 Tax=Sediminibacillus massiliensis TaxID=1926277 RepID=UPI0009886B6D|nr:helix-turn-helix transcriptional regulator [Sediminibacillus massiliensis]
MKVGAILRAARQRRGFSQEELAHMLHINQSDISKYENDTKEPSISLFQQWTTNTQAQEVFVAYLCGLDGIGMMQNLVDFTTTSIGMIMGGMLF